MVCGTSQQTLWLVAMGLLVAGQTQHRTQLPQTKTLVVVQPITTYSQQWF
jgi:hypothetical protein